MSRTRRGKRAKSERTGIMRIASTCSCRSRACRSICATAWRAPRHARARAPTFRDHRLRDDELADEADQPIDLRDRHRGWRQPAPPARSGASRSAPPRSRRRVAAGAWRRSSVRSTSFASPPVCCARSVAEHVARHEERVDDVPPVTGARGAERVQQQPRGREARDLVEAEHARVALDGVRGPEVRFKAARRRPGPLRARAARPRSRRAARPLPRRRSLRRGPRRGVFEARVVPRGCAAVVGPGGAAFAPRRRRPDVVGGLGESRRRLRGRGG